jgi:hypothetical protein
MASGAKTTLILNGVNIRRSMTLMTKFNIKKLRKVCKECTEVKNYCRLKCSECAIHWAIKEEEKNGR